MKKYLLLIPAMLMAVGMQAQEKLSVETKKGDKYEFTVGVNVDSIRIIEGTGIKVYWTGGEGRSQDFLMSQITYKHSVDNANRNTAADLKKNREGWRLEFPRFYQGSNVTYEKSYYITDMKDEKGRNPVNFSVEWDGTRRANRWTCYQMYQDVAAKKVERGKKFYPDKEIPAEHRSELNDYKKSGHTRGHLCPSNDRVCSRAANDQTFILTNMQPQVQGHNGGVWSQLEQRIKDDWFYEKGTTNPKCDTLYIVKAATMDNEADILGTTRPGVEGVNHLIIPKYFYMALLAYHRASGKYEAMGIWSLHEKGSQTEFITIDELERRTGIDFFCNLPDNIENQVEKTVDGAYWNVTPSGK